MKIIQLEQNKSAFYQYYDRTPRDYPRTMRVKRYIGFEGNVSTFLIGQKPLNECEIATHSKPHYCDPHINQTKFNELLPLTIAGVLTLAPSLLQTASPLSTAQQTPVGPTLGKCALRR